MTFGTGVGWSADEASSRAMFESYLEHGGNFIDTAISYTNGRSETLLGTFLAGRREQLVLAIGARTQTQLLANMQALSIELSPEQLTELNQVSAIELGFPHDFLAQVRASALDGGVTITDLPSHTRYCNVM